ncbi:unnamed protein product [Lota lota]
MSNQVVRGLLTACFASFGDSANPSILLSVLRAEEWATDAPVNGLRQEMDWEAPPHRPPLSPTSGPVPVHWHNLDPWGVLLGGGGGRGPRWRSRMEKGLVNAVSLVSHGESRSSGPQGVRMGERSCSGA